ncbi:MAG: UDP-N-acetylmuramoylalanyl-D-glutamyl-2,6-diaminopimelate--D-alanyl-D-alanine ligase [Rhodospirillaceae bacterium]|nr:UDP-N-acetylmuramoylalanyl-D-glutamyl-2,6-diaminopimelate--D-alanyl-D-alanine ligase [Rhodospirillaceae bacterium]
MSAPVLWTTQDAVAATDGRAVGQWRATGVAIDSRTVAPGDLFVAIRGPNFDAHDFVAEALARGAVAALVHRPPPGVAADAPLLTVDDTLEGLTALGRFARLRSRARVAAVTGSVGKTSTKEALRLALAAEAKTYASAGNLNNHWGVPLSLARLPPACVFAVFELGMNHAGEIAPLSRLVKPEVAIITGVEAVHLENFPSVDAIADAKAEIFAGMSPAGAAVLNRDNRYFPHLVAHARTQGLSRIWSFGEHPQCDARLDECALFATGSVGRAVIRGEPIDFTLSVPGKHWVLNGLAVLLAVKALGGDMATAARALNQFAPMKGRGAARRVVLDRAGARGAFVLIDESYNASPTSVTAALAVLGQTAPQGQGRRIAVLGDMLELGPEAVDLHRSLATAIRANGVEAVYACGPLMTALMDDLPPALRGAHAPDSAALADIVADAVRPGDVVLVKGSLGSRMATVIAALDRLDAAAARPTNDDRPPRLAVNGG